jgi:glycosyltransferase involved in cell wall biosynthesis
VTDTTVAVLAALPWIVTPIVTAIRVLGSKSLDDESAAPPENPPLVSVVIPARNEARNIERCLRSVLSNDYPRFEVVVVNDGSTDATGNIAQSIAAADNRARVIETEGLPEGWFGKQWACETGARATSGEIILFADADTTQSSDLITRSVNAMLRRNADLFSVLGRQELGTFWERLIQPQIFTIMSVRYGGTESVTRSRFVKDKIANGQCLFVRRSTYEEFGGHSLVKSHVADDMMLAQRYFARGRRVVLEEGIHQLSTRMYTSLGELVRGWGKNVFAGGRDSVPFGLFGRLLFPLLLLSGPLFNLVPALVLIASLVVPVSSALLLWATIAEVAMLVWWIYLYSSIGESPFYSLLSPLGALMVFYIFLRAALRGQRVLWKGRQYISQ